MPPKGPSHNLPMEGDAQRQGNAILSGFFQRLPKPGRPAGSVQKVHGPLKKRPLPPPPPAPAVRTAATAQQLPEPPAPTPKDKVKEKRTNWAAGENLEKLTGAVNNWLNKTGELLLAEPTMALHTYAARVGIPNSTMHDYCKSDARCEHLEKSRVCAKRVLYIAPQKDTDAVYFCSI